MEAVQIVQNPVTLVSGKVASSGTGQAGDATAPAIFEQMFAQATAGAGAAGQATVEAVLPMTAVQQVTFAESASLPLTGRIPVLLPAGDSGAVESIAGEATEASATARPAMSNEAGLELTRMLVRNPGKNGRIPEQGGPTQGKKLEKTGDAPDVQSEVTVKSKEETVSTGDALSTEEKKPEIMSVDDVSVLIPVVTPEFVATPMIVKENRATVSGEVFTLPAKSAFEASAESVERGQGRATPAIGAGKALAEAAGTIAEETQAPAVNAYGETGSTGTAGVSASSEEVTVPAGGKVATTATAAVFSAEEKNSEGGMLKNVVPSGENPSTDGVSQRGRQGDLPVRESLEVKNTVKGETVLRQVPGEVTVTNPARTVLMGNSPFHAEMTAVIRQGAEAETQPVRKTDEGIAAVSETVPAETDLTATPNTTSLSSGEGSLQQDAGGGTGERQVFVSISPSGNSETAQPGRMETQPTVEKTDLHESIMSQVREKLVSPEQGNGTGRITLKLNPRELGDMQIHLRMEDAKVSVEITAQNPVVREALAQNLDQLKETLSRQNITMERFDVMTGNGQTSNQSFREGRQTAQPHFDGTYSPDAGYYPDESEKSSIAYGDKRENSLVDMRF